MRLYLVSLGAGLLAGIFYGLIGVRSPAPPLIALVGLAGILLGEQIVPLARHLADRAQLVRDVQDDCPSRVPRARPETKESDECIR
ncbi:DUF1427 family protein [Croceicoccus sp. BE223]|uniref:DUF1427 family protein n=1 Tax=Croceicoccus sp. BE223 TaxID=2817716 RepID=UPI0028604178|nr:DUF1427 family protein [Croceicoccus sp. BE223]MDR7103024.1 XapX domain-containing protein [Croceicoccus sp. BE223]